MNNFFCLITFQAVLDFKLLAGVPERRNVGFALVNVAQVNTALREFADDNLAQSAQPPSVLSRECNLILLIKNKGGASFKVEPCGQFLARLVKRVIHLLLIDLRNNVERRHTVRSLTNQL